MKILEFDKQTNKQTNKQINNQNKWKYQNNKNLIIHLLDAKYAPFAMYTLMFRKNWVENWFVSLSLRLT